VTTEFVGVRTPVELVEWLAQRTMTSTENQKHNQLARQMKGYITWSIRKTEVDNLFLKLNQSKKNKSSQYFLCRWTL